MVTDFSKLNDKELAFYSNLMFQKLSSAEEVRDWIKFFLGHEFPVDPVDPDSTSSPLNAVWTIYEVFLNNSGDVTPGAIILSCREGLKTFSVSVLEILLLFHFSLEIAHGAATETQAAVSLKYIEQFLYKISPLIEKAGWTSTTQNKRTIQYKNPENESPFIKIVICTPKGMNSLHAQILFLDELDLSPADALAEAVNIVGYSKGIFGMTVYLSTRKYSGGPMQAALDRADEMGYKILKWNIIDVTEKCPPKRHLPKGPKQDVYVGKSLPLQRLTREEYRALPPTEQVKFELIENAHEGCAKCPLLPVCKMKLADRSKYATGGFYKPISAVIQKFKENSAEVAECQLMCWKPGSAGLVYPRFSKDKEKGNVITIADAYTTLTGKKNAHVSFDTLLKTMQKLGIPFYAGVDWGFTHEAVILIVAKMPNDEIWGMDCFAAPGLEFTDMLQAAITYRDQYGIQKWFCDQAMPSHIKSFSKNGMKSPVFTKDVIGGVEAIRSKVTNASGKRFLKFLDTPTNKKAINSFATHRFILDSQGNPTPKPDDEPLVADICDAGRYIGQNLFPVKGTQKPNAVWTETDKPINHNPTHTEQMRAELAKHVTQVSDVKTGTAKKGSFFFTQG